jgi:hypothetical protein
MEMGAGVGEEEREEKLFGRPPHEFIKAAKSGGKSGGTGP